MKDTKLHSNTAGFTVVEVAITITVFLLIVLIGFAYSNSHQTNASLILQRQKYIDKYVHNLNLQNYSSFANTLYKNGYLTTSLFKTTQSLTNSYSNDTLGSNPSYSQIICVQQIPSSFTYGPVNVSASGITATLPVKVFTLDDSNPTPYVASWTKINGNWQLNNATCSQ